MRAAGRWFAPMNASGGCKDVQKQPTADQETVRTASCHQPHIDRHIPACTPKPIATNDHALGGKPCSQDQARSKRSTFMPLFQATTKSLTNFSFASSCLQISAIARSCELEPKVRSTRVAVWNGGQHRGDVCRSADAARRAGRALRAALFVLTFVPSQKFAHHSSRRRARRCPTRKRMDSCF